MLSAGGYDVKCESCGKGTSAHEIVVGFESLGACSVVTIETTVEEGEAIFLEEFAVCSCSVGGAFAGKVLVDPFHSIGNRKVNT